MKQNATGNRLWEALWSFLKLCFKMCMWIMYVLVKGLAFLLELLDGLFKQLLTK